jgi:hypothetical protein
MGAPLLGFETVYETVYQSLVYVPHGVTEIADIVTLDLPAITVWYIFSLNMQWGMLEQRNWF